MILLRFLCRLCCSVYYYTGVKREEDLKVREKTLQSLRIKGAFTAQELYDGHRGTEL